jgi:hypothetical protein
MMNDAEAAVEGADAEIDRLRAENARLTAAAIALVADVRAAIGDNGQRMQPALIEYVLCLRADAERYRVIRDWPNRDNLGPAESLLSSFSPRAVTRSSARMGIRRPARPQTPTGSSARPACPRCRLPRSVRQSAAMRRRSAASMRRLASACASCG